MLVAVACAAGAVVGGGVLALKALFGDGEEEAQERMNAKHLSTELALEKTFKRETVYIHRKGVRLYMQTWFPQGEPKGVVLLLHGMNGHGGRATPFFEVLLRAGYIGVSFDLRGFGRSSGRHGYVRSISDLADDAFDVLQRLKERYPTKRLILLGGSMGGLTAVHTALRIQTMSEPLISGLILHAPALHVHADARPPWIVEKIGRLLVLIAPKLPLLQAEELPQSADGSPLNVPEEPDELFYSGRLRLGTGLAILTGIEAVSTKLQQLELPFIVQHGDADTMVDIEASRHLHAVAASKDKTILEYPRGGHLLWAEPAFIRDPFMQDMVNWLDARQ